MLGTSCSKRNARVAICTLSRAQVSTLPTTKDTRQTNVFATTYSAHLYIIIMIIIIIMKNFNRRSSHSHHGSKRGELRKHAHSRGSHAFTHTLTSIQLQPRCAKRQLNYYIIWNRIFILKRRFEFISHNIIIIMIRLMSMIVVILSLFFIYSSSSSSSSPSSSSSSYYYHYYYFRLLGP